MSSPARPAGGPARPTAPPVFQRPVRPDWWLAGRYSSPSRQGRSAYLLFMLRELSSIVIALFLVLYLVQIARLGGGDAAYVPLRDSLRSPAMLLLHLVALIAAIYHTVTWLQLTGVVMVLRLGMRLVRPREMVLGGYLLWAAASVAVFLVLTR